MSVRINVETKESEAVVRVHGVLDQSLVEVTAAGLIGLGRDFRRVVVDLRDAVLASTVGITHLVDALRAEAAAEEIALVCDRLPGRRLLRLTCGPGDVRVLSELPPGAAAASAIDVGLTGGASTDRSVATAAAGGVGDGGSAVAELV
jgi:hypothetical protein